MGGVEDERRNAKMTGSQRPSARPYVLIVGYCPWRPAGNGAGVNATRRSGRTPSAPFNRRSHPIGNSDPMAGDVSTLGVSPIPCVDYIRGKAHRRDGPARFGEIDWRLFNGAG
ncbi:hypothetical protein V490_09243 [Pseudogymnoascus sp. VKM F-3557]|nr:hypothetical protein V490_09243 [Pseudogymnoascus sp. VKM F-3557]